MSLANTRAAMFTRGSLLLASPLTNLVGVVLFLGWAVLCLARRMLSLPVYNYLFLAGLMYLFGAPWTRLPLYAIEAFLLFQLSTLVFDVIHRLLHLVMRSRFRPLRWLGGLHQTHHDFLDRELRFHDDLRRGNNLRHVIPETVTRLAVCAAALLVLDPVPVVRTVLLEAIVFALYFKNGGNDSNHQAHPALKASQPNFFVDTWYHSLHHLHPESYFSSINTLVDRLLGHGCHLDGRRVAVAGDSELRRALGCLLEEDGATVRYGADELSDTDVLVLCGEQDAGWVELVEGFLRATAPRRFPVEVWALISERELARAGAFAPHGRRYFTDERFYYRHVVLSETAVHATRAEARRAARIARFWIRRGFRYAPASLTGLALLNFFRFRYTLRPAPTEG